MPPRLRFALVLLLPMLLMLGCSGGPTKTQKFLVFQDISGSEDADDRKSTARPLDFIFGEVGGRGVFSFWTFDKKVHTVNSNRSFRNKRELHKFVDENIVPQQRSSSGGTYFAPVINTIVEECEKTSGDEPIFAVLLTRGGFNDEKEAAKVVKKLQVCSRLQRLIIGPITDEESGITKNAVIDDVKALFQPSGKAWIFTQTDRKAPDFRDKVEELLK